MQEEIKNGINAENKEKRKLDDAELAQVTGGEQGGILAIITVAAAWLKIVLTEAQQSDCKSQI